MEAPEIVARMRCACGEGPLWHPRENRLYFVDIDPGRLFRFEPATLRCDLLKEGPAIGGFTVQDDGSLLLFQAEGAVRFWNEGAQETLFDALEGEEETRFNDVAAAPSGGVFCGTMPARDRPGRLYYLTPQGEPVRLLDGIGCSNGIGFSPDLRTMYYTDSAAQTIYAFDHDPDTADIGNRRVLIRIGEPDVLPDGLTVDAEGCLWSALWNGHGVMRISPKGEEMDCIALPCSCVTSVAFGGENLEALYITTAGGKEDQPIEAPEGCLFRAYPGVKGKPEFLSRVQRPGAA